MAYVGVFLKDFAYTPSYIIVFALTLFTSFSMHIYNLFYPVFGYYDFYSPLLHVQTWGIYRLNVCMVS